MPLQITSLYDFFEQVPDEQAAIDLFRSIHWKDGEAFCPKCGSTRVYHFKDNRTHKCGRCRKRFSIKVGTIFEDTKIPMRKWLAAVWMITNYPKGVASTQLAKNLKVTQKTAWFMLHRLRHASRTNSFNAPMKGNVEIDETYIGGKEKNKHGKRKRYLGPVEGKATVFGMLERGGEVRARKVKNMQSATIKPIVTKNLDSGTKIMSDDAVAFLPLGSIYRRGVVNHSAGQWTLPDGTHTNTIEGFWSLFKRQYHGTHHWISDKHLQKYLNEMCYRYSHRDLEEGERMSDFLGRTHGRLTYKALTHGEATEAEV